MRLTKPSCHQKVRKTEILGHFGPKMSLNWTKVTDFTCFWNEPVYFYYFWGHLSKILYDFPMNSTFRMYFRLAEIHVTFWLLKCHRRAKIWPILIKVAYIDYLLHAWCNEEHNFIFGTNFFYLDLLRVSSWCLLSFLVFLGHPHVETRLIWHSNVHYQARHSIPCNMHLKFPFKIS